MIKLLAVDDVFLIHEQVINHNELQGLAANKSLDSIIGRIENRIQYGLINDIYDLAASYAVVIAVGHVFNDANKRTAFTAMDVCLRKNDVFIKQDIESIGQMIIKVAQGLVDEAELARYLRLKG